MTAMIGWAGTTQFQDAWVYDQAAETYAFDPAMAEQLRQPGGISPHHWSDVGGGGAGVLAAG
jgi:magnesium chelatase subunit H